MHLIFNQIKKYLIPRHVLDLELIDLSMHYYLQLGNNINKWPKKIKMDLKIN